MSNNTDQENPSGNDDNTDATNDIGENNYFRCTFCKVRSFFTYLGLNQYLPTCLRKAREVIVANSQPASSRAVNDLQSTTESQQRQNVRENVNEEYTNIKWGERNLREVSKKIQDAYERHVFWKKNLFMLPTGAATKKCITETTKLMNGWTDNSPLKGIAFTVMHVIPSLLLQKPSKTSKAKDHLKALERRIDLWINGNIDEHLFEGETIQSRLHYNNTRKSIGKLSKKITLLMEKGNVNGALKLLTSNISNGMLPLDDKTLSLLKQKHPASCELNEEVLLRERKTICTSCSI